MRVLKVRLNKALLLTLRLLGLFGLFGFALGFAFGFALGLTFGFAFGLAFGISFLIVRATLGWSGVPLLLLLLGGATSLIGAICALRFTVAALVQGSALFVALEFVFVAN